MNKDNKQINRELFLEFQESIIAKFAAFCHRENIKDDLFTLIDFIYQTNIIKDSTIAKYMVMDLYPASLFENDSKMNAITDISIQTGLSEKTVYNMVQHPESFGYGISKKSNKKNNNK